MPFVVLSLSDRVHEYLRERIVSHKIPPGEAIRQDALAAELGVSKIPIREALSRLVESNMVQANANRGFVAAPLSLNELEELFELRLLLEPPIAAKTSVSAGQAQRERVKAAMDNMVPGSKTLDDATRQRRSLMLALLDQTGRSTTRTIVFQVFDRSERYHPPFQEPSKAESDALQSVLSAWLEGDPDRVTDLYRETLQRRVEQSRASFKS